MNRRELRRSVKEARAQLRARVAQLPAVQQARTRTWRRRRRALLVTLVLLLLLLLSRCQCAVAPPPSPATPALSKPPLVPAKVEPPKPLIAKVKPQPRPKLATDARPAPSWLDDFRLQVAARSGRLAECVNGSEHPGALRWTASVTPASGAVSQQELEPVGGAVLPPDARTCLQRALSTPPYRLSPDAAEALPPRVTLVIEF